MPNYYYPTYCTIYSAEVNGNVLPVRRDACYANSLHLCKRIKNIAKYNIYLCKDQSMAISGWKNQCWMSKHQIENYLRRIKSVMPFGYKVVESVWRDYPCFRIDMNICGTKKEITFVLQCIKRIYEWPFNFFLLQAYKMQEMKEYKRDSILNLYNVVYSTFKDLKNEDHSFSGNTYFEKYSTLKERLPHVEYTSDIYPDYCRNTVRSPKIANIQYHQGYPSNTEQFTDELFEKLLPTYVKNYKALKR